MLPNLKCGGVVVNELRVMKAENAAPLREGPREAMGRAARKWHLRRCM
jgi:hypothetical protein